MSDKDKYVQELRERIEAEKKRNDAMLESFKEASDLAQLKASLIALSAIRDDEAAVQKAMMLVRDKQMDASIRILALQKVRGGLSNNLDFLRTCLDLLADSTNDRDLRIAVFDTLKAASFGSTQFATLRPEYMSLLRTLLDDPDATIKAMAAEDLALNKDEFVQRRLLAELQTREEKIVSRAKAIQLLGHDIHAEHFPIVKKILEEETASETEKIEAIHVLAKDPSSKELLKNLMLDKTQVKEIRLSSATALHALQPEEFINAAKQVVVNEKEDKDLRIVSLNAMMQHLDTDALKKDDEFLKNVSKLRTLSLSPGLKKVSRIYTERMTQKKKDENRKSSE